jgi:hypothetical protein
LSERPEPRVGDCGDQEGDGLLNCAWADGVANWAFGRADIHNGVAYAAFGGSGDTQSAVKTEVAARDELIESQWILPLWIYTSSCR